MRRCLCVRVPWSFLQVCDDNVKFGAFPTTLVTLDVQCATMCVRDYILNRKTKSQWVSFLLSFACSVLLGLICRQVFGIRYPSSQSCPLEHALLIRHEGKPPVHMGWEGNRSDGSSSESCPRLVISARSFSLLACVFGVSAAKGVGALTTKSPHCGGSTLVQ